MSKTISIDFNVDTSVEVVRILRCCLEQNWSIIVDNEISYLPFSDDEMFNWQKANYLAANMVFDEIEKKEKANEIIGIVLIDKISRCGGEFLIWPDYSSFSISFSINKNNMFEVEYYIGRLRELVSSYGIGLLDFEVEDI